MKYPYYILGYCEQSRGLSGHLSTRFTTIYEAYTYYNSLDKSKDCQYNKIFIVDNSDSFLFGVYGLNYKNRFITIKDARRIAILEQI